MSTDRVVPKRWRMLYDALKAFHGGEETEQILEELGTAESLVRDLARELNHVQWLMGWCPVCMNRDKRGHSDDCSLKAALDRIPAHLRAPETTSTGESSTVLRQEEQTK